MDCRAQTHQIENENNSLTEHHLTFLKMFMWAIVLLELVWSYPVALSIFDIN